MRRRGSGGARSIGVAFLAAGVVAWTGIGAPAPAATAVDSASVAALEAEAEADTTAVADERAIVRLLEQAERAGAEGRWEDAAGRFLEIAGLQRDDGAVMMALSNAAVCLARAGRDAAAGDRLLAAATLASGRGPIDPDAPLVLANRAQWLLDHDRPEAADVAAIAADRAEAAFIQAQRMRARRIEAEAARRARSWDRAFAAYAAARNIEAVLVPEEGEADERLELALVGARIDIDRRQWDAARTALEELSRMARKRRNRSMVFRANLDLAGVEARAERPAAAEQALRWARSRADRPQDLTTLFARRIEIARWQERAEDAVREAEQCLAHAEEWIDAAPDPAEEELRRRDARRWLETALVEAAGPGVGEDDAAAARRAAGWIRAIVHGTGAPTAALDPGDVHVLWFWGARDVVPLIERARRDGSTRWQRLASTPADPLEGWIRLFRGLVLATDRPETADAVGRRIEAAIWPGVDPRAADRWVLEPDGPLQGLPFAALPAGPGDRGGALGLAVPLLRWDAAAREARNADAGPPTSPVDLLVVADPVLVSPGEASPGEADEVADVLAREDPSAVVLRGAEAREARLRATPATILHVAAPWDGPLRDPALLLTPGDGDDGRLEVSEIPAFPDPPQIAVLAGAATEPAEGADTPASLAIGRAFLAAGTGTVIETIDGARSRPGRTEWLADVHRGLRRGLRPSEAVRQARIRASESGDPARATAAAWAPWTVVGRDLPVVRSDATGTRRPADPGAAGIGWAAAIAFFGVTAELLRRRRASRGNGSAPRGA